jgi:toxin ParE1/3/4
MTVRVEILAGAREDLKQSRAYIRRKFGQEAVGKFLATMRSELQALANDYKTGAIPDELANLGRSDIRQKLVGQSRVIYQTTQDTIFVHIICHSRRDLTTLLQQRSLKTN